MSSRYIEKAWPVRRSCGRKALPRPGTARRLQGLEPRGSSRRRAPVRTLALRWGRCSVRSEAVPGSDRSSL